jgi:CRISPR-associated endonuclease Cas2
VRYIAAHDIACPKRLRRVANLMKKHAIRLQKSVYLLPENCVNPSVLAELVRPLLDDCADLFQIWKLAGTDSAACITLGQPAVALAQGAVLGTGGINHLVSRAVQTTAVFME